MKFFMMICPVLGMLFSGCRTTFDMAAAVKDFDAERYCGVWYEIARLPNWFQSGMYHVSAEYTGTGDGRIRVVNQGLDASGQRRMVIGRGLHDRGGVREIAGSPLDTFPAQKAHPH